MNSPPPPPLPHGTVGAAWKTYLVAALIVAPALFFWLFASLVLLPKANRLWVDAGLEGSSAQWFMDTSQVLVRYLSYTVMAFLGFFAFLEATYRSWPQRRRAVVTAAAVLLNAVVLFGITGIAVVALMAAPRLPHGSKGPIGKTGFTQKRNEEAGKLTLPGN